MTSRMIPATKEDVAQLQTLLLRPKHGREMGQHLTLYAAHPIPEENDRGGRNANNWQMVVQGTVQEGWVNGLGNLHGAAAAWLVDQLTSAALSRLATPTFWGPPMLGGVSIQLDMTYYNPAPTGTKVRIVVTVERMARTLANTRCDILEWDTGKRLASGTHAKAWRPAKM
ncbi:hypothetical protein CspHIS471_0606960 [Cutaneotrichosporon sp. HIS471]|nr:hypothetical protein CspHIS471_0606960 [Cutaneotrichosporon sp. HIS471]